MKIGVIGCGYWGKIIINNLIQLGQEDLVLCDNDSTLSNLNFGRKFELTNDYKKVNCDKVFVLTPVTHHYEVCKYFLQKGVDVFCEKVLTDDVGTAKDLYKTADKNKSNLFVDWIFTFNNQVNLIKKVYDTGVLGDVRHVFLNRQNYGPFRDDVDARYDLASHDLSILLHIFEKSPKEVKWINYKRDKSQLQDDSAIGYFDFHSFTSVVNASWSHSKKDRKCYFDFDNGYITWDDSTKSLKIDCKEDIIMSTENNESPLHISINNFLSNELFGYKKQREMTLKIIEALNEN
tara:strand:+ start:5914 stop:6786 length:873 start_codon:yes stop_codon:yes gene_type:complete